MFTFLFFRVFNSVGKQIGSFKATGNSESSAWIDAIRQANDFWDFENNPQLRTIKAISQRSEIVFSLDGESYTEDKISRRKELFDNPLVLRAVDGNPVFEEYRRGFSAGRRDTRLVTQPCNEGGHTLSEYQRIRAALEEAVDAFEPTPYQLGYADGSDVEAFQIYFEREDADSLNKYEFRFSEFFWIYSDQLDIPRQVRQHITDLRVKES